MAVPDYFQRNAVAATQAISGLDEERLTERLAAIRVGLTLGRDAAGAEGEALTDLLIRLLARLYPTLSIRDESNGASGVKACNLARRINPAIEFVEQPTIEVVIGASELPPAASQRLFVGSSAWSAAVSTRRPQRWGGSRVPFGAGAAACLGSANLFRYVFVPEPELDDDATFELLPPEEAAKGDLGVPEDLGKVVLGSDRQCCRVGTGARGDDRYSPPHRLRTDRSW